MKKVTLAVSSSGSKSPKLITFVSLLQLNSHVFTHKKMPCFLTDGETSSDCWNRLKFSFIIFNSLLSIGIITLINHLVETINFRAETTLQLNASDIDIRFQEAKIIATILIFCILFLSFLMVLGFIGILRSNLKCLYSYTFFLFVTLIIAILKGIFDTVSLWFISFNLVYLCLMFFILIEFEKLHAIDIKNPYHNKCHEDPFSLFFHEIKS